MIKELPVIPLREMVVFPRSILPLLIARHFSKNAFHISQDLYKGYILFLAQEHSNIARPKKSDIHKIGTRGRILQHYTDPDETIRCIIEGVDRVKVNILRTKGSYENKYFIAKYELHSFLKLNYKDLTLHFRMIREAFSNLIKFERIVPEEILTTILTNENPYVVSNLVASHLPIPTSVKQELLEKKTFEEFLLMLHDILLQEIEFRKLKSKIENRVKDEILEGQKKIFLHEEMKQIQKELGYEDEDNEFIEIQKSVKSSGMPNEVKKKVMRELRRLKKMPPLTPESSVIRTYLEWLTSLPWDKRTKDNLNLNRVRAVLDNDHYGLEEPKKRILEYLAVLKLKGQLRGQILCFVGPPGVGKTSLARSIARSLGRKFVRMSLGGIKDEAEIRGHRRTYIGALPGRIIQGIRKAGSKNPVFLLDEIDKVGMDFRGDPYAALMEVLDPEVNRQFQDHYLEVEFDLSEVLFITTANILHTIPLVLKDRMEIISLPGYLDDEKFYIAKGHLIPKLINEAGLKDGIFRISDKAIYKVIHSYTKESGVRELERRLGKLVRLTAHNWVNRKKKTYIQKKTLEKHLGPQVYTAREGERSLPPGVVYGLAWTETGGEILRIEVLTVPGKGKLTLTGQLGDVLKESAYAALSYIRSRSQRFKLNTDFYEKHDIHLHIPEGSIPKDGPSAGASIVCALVSALTGHRSSSDIAITGEITLTGEVLKIGGLQEKIGAAKRGKLKQIVVPQENMGEVKRIRKTLKEGILFHYVKHIDEIIDIMFPRVFISRFPKEERAIAGS